jgi:hypothetical protein
MKLLYIQYMYIVGKCNIYLFEISKQIEKRTFCQIVQNTIEMSEKSFIENIHRVKYFLCDTMLIRTVSISILYSMQ